MPGPYTPIPHTPQQLQSAATTGTGGLLYLRGGTARVTVVLQSTGTTSGGAVSIEEAYYDQESGDPVYAGTWSVVQAVNASDFTGTAQKVVHLTGSFWALRVRISSTITGGGMISVWAWGN